MGVLPKRVTGRARTPLRAVGGRDNRLILHLFRCSRRAAECAPHLQTLRRFGQRARKLRPPWWIRMICEWSFRSGRPWVMIIREVSQMLP
jgi:hypothetical protein